MARATTEETSSRIDQLQGPFIVLTTVRLRLNSIPCLALINTHYHDERTFIGAEECFVHYPFADATQHTDDADICSGANDGV